MPNKKMKKYNARFPPARIKKIMQKDEEVGKVAAAVPVIISRALELFVESLIRKTSEVTQTRNAKTLTTTHLKQCILTENQFDFLKDLVASVPDVQGDDDNSNPLPLSSNDPTAASRLTGARTKRQRMTKTRKYGGINAGPSHTGMEEDSEEDEEDSDEEEEDDDEDGSRSEDSLPSTGLPYFNHQGFTGHMYGKPSPNGVPIQPTSETANKNLFGSISMSKMAAPTLDEDYDS